MWLLDVVRDDLLLMRIQMKSMFRMFRMMGKLRLLVRDQVFLMMLEHGFVSYQCLRIGKVNRPMWLTMVARFCQGVTTTVARELVPVLIRGEQLMTIGGLLMVGHLWVAFIRLGERGTKEGCTEENLFG